MPAVHSMLNLLALRFMLNYTDRPTSSISYIFCIFCIFETRQVDTALLYQPVLASKMLFRQHMQLVNLGSIGSIGVCILHIVYYSLHIVLKCACFVYT